MLTAHELIGFMSPSLATDILNFAYEEDKPLYRATLSAVAGVRKVRPVFMERQPRTERHAAMLAPLRRPALEPAARKLIPTRAVKKQKAIVGGFPDWEGIPHSEG